MNGKLKTSTAADWVQTLPEEVDKGPCRYGESFYVGAQIKELALDASPLHKFKAEFKKDSVNAIYGGGGAGKSIILRSILHAFGIQHKYFDANHITILKTYRSIGKCLLVDDAFRTVSTELLPSALKDLRKLHTQIIATLRVQDPEVIKENVDQIIRLG